MSNTVFEIVGILLAAGSSRRYGSDKLTQPLPDGGDWVVVRAAANLRESLDRVLAVVRPGQEGLRAELRLAGIDVVLCEQAEQGMGTSMATGVAHCGAAAGCLIALGDMPWIRPATVGAVASAIRRGAGIAAPTFAGRRGHPVGFSPAYRASLLKLAGDQGARDLLREHAAQVQFIACDDPGILLDIDTPMDLNAYRR